MNRKNSQDIDFFASLFNRLPVLYFLLAETFKIFPHKNIILKFSYI